MKTFSQFAFATAILATTALFSACGDDVTEVTEVNEIHQEGMAVLDAGLELSKQKCDTTNVGDMLFVTDSSEVFVCDGKNWQTLKGADGIGKDGSSCTAKPVKDSAGLEGLEVTCGETVVGTIWNGEKGNPGEDGNDGNDGTSCTASVNKGGDFELVCGGKSVGTIKNGANGNDGLPGADGDDGSDGESCTASVNKDGDFDLVCGGKSVGTIKNGANGIDGESCTAKPVTNDAGLEGLEVTCGETVVGTIWNGVDGNDGKPGEDGVDGDDGIDGESCTAKPVTNDAGLEGLEVTCGKTVVGTIWNGEKGEPGKDGEDGDDGVGCSVKDEGDGTVTVSCGEGKTTLYKAMCGANPYDPAKSFCSGGEVYELCDGKTYDPKEQYCLKVTRGETDIYSMEALLTDDRDEQHIQVYKTVKICNDDKSSCQTWMAQNLNYAPDENHVDSLGDGARSSCYNHSAESCAKYGRLYTWEVAMDKAGCGYGESCNNSYEGSQGICPEGWHLPTYAEWDTLITNVGGENVAGRMLKSEEGWNYYSESTKGIDYYGFSALPAGCRDDNGDFNSAGDRAPFWSSSEDNIYYTYDMVLYHKYLGAYLYDDSKYDAISVRCLKD